MAFKNKVISNSKTGQQIKFIQTAKDTDGKLLEMEATYSPGSKEPAAHYHPYQTEIFTILSGELTVRIDGGTKILRSGDTLRIPANKSHSMWNGSEEKTVVSWKVSPAMNTEILFETMTGLANNNKTNKDGMPGILQLALTANKFANEVRLSKPPFVIQKILFLLLTPVAMLKGYKPVYKKYLD